MQQDDIIIDGSLLTRVFQQQLRAWILKGLLLFGLLLLLALSLVPRTYTSNASMAIQQPSSGGGALAALTGGGGASKRYLGVLKSRRAAEQVERHVHLKQLYGLRLESDAVEMLMKSIKLEDNAVDGLLYITVTLPGHPKLSLKHSPTDAQIKETVVQTTNMYTLVLKEYYRTSDNDQGAALLRGADKEIRQSRADYNAAFERAMDFNRGLRGVDPRSAPGSGQTGPETGSSGDTLLPLYAALGQVQAELRSDQAARQTRDALTGQQIRNLADIPADDPLLATARSQVTNDQAAYETAIRLYGSENPVVIRAQTQLEVDKAQLARQIQGVKRRLTTPNLRSDEQIQSLYAKQSALQGQIAQAGKRLGVKRALSGEFARLQTEVAIQLAVLNSTMTGAARVRLENASSASRMSIIDTAIPPKSGEPGMLRLALACLGLVILAFLISIVRAYLKQARVISPNSSPSLETVPRPETAEAAGKR